jgi:hypothetical protein
METVFSNVTIVMVKGGMLKDDADWSTLGIKEGHTFMMMGSADEIPKGPVERPVFVEDLAPNEAAMAEVKRRFLNANLSSLLGILLV